MLWTHTRARRRRRADNQSGSLCVLTCLPMRELPVDQSRLKNVRAAPPLHQRAPISLCDSPRHGAIFAATPNSGGAASSGSRVSRGAARGFQITRLRCWRISQILDPTDQTGAAPACLTRIDRERLNTPLHHSAGAAGIVATKRYQQRSANSPETMVATPLRFGRVATSRTDVDEGRNAQNKQYRSI